jgi:putative endopeptidase
MLQHGGKRPSVPSPDTSIDPGHDFYSYINNNWQKHIHLPSFAGGYGVSEEIEEDVRDTLLELIQRMRTTHPTSKLSILATSFLHTASQKNSVIDLQRVLNTFECMGGVKDVCHSIGSMNKIQAHAPLSLVVSSDSYNSNKCVIYLYEPALGLPEKSYYKTETRNHILLKYSKLLATVGDIMNIESLDAAVSIEASLIPYLSSGDDLMNMEFSYNPHSFNELQHKYKNIDWEAMMAGWGVDSETCKKAQFIVTNVAYMNALNRMMTAFSLETWRTFMRAQIVNSFVEYLPPPFDDMHFELYGKALKGTAGKIPQKFLTLKVLQTFVPNDLGRLFVKHAVEDGTKSYALKLVNRLKKATIERLRALEWMAPPTKNAAVKKVETMKFQIGFPSSWESELEDALVENERPLLNLLTLSSRNTAKMIEDLKYNRCNKDTERWDEGVFEVNAYYYSEGNMMVVPAGILRSPFFDVNRSDAWNLGGIGAAIGHEITHGFDADGRLYDDKGNYNDWWTKRDSMTFEALSEAIIKLFDGQPYMGGKVDGKLTLSENIADLGGLAIALQALESVLPEDASKRKHAYREFFTSYAVSWRNKDRLKKAKQSLLLDSHAPAPLRVNLIVRQFSQFYTAFDIADSHPNFIPTESRINLW